MSRRVCLGLTVAAALVVAGCGSDGDDDQPHENEKGSARSSPTRTTPAGDRGPVTCSVACQLHVDEPVSSSPRERPDLALLRGIAGS
jgi:hypothetical protein